MTTFYESLTARQEDIDNVIECFGDITELAWKFPINALAEDGRHPEEVEEGIRRLSAAYAVMVSEGPRILWAFVNARELTDDVEAMLDG
jgi:hypothetical protein